MNHSFPLVLLQDGNQQTTHYNKDVENIKRIVINALTTNGIGIDGIHYAVCPSIVRVEFTLSKGVKISNIRLLGDILNQDETLSELRPILLVAPIPGKNAFAVEVPRSDRRMICLREVLKSKEFQESKEELPIALGISTENKPVIANLRKMPHLLIGGASGMGKSMLLNSIIVSLLYSKGPEELKFMLIDPKMVGFVPFSNINERYLVKIEGVDEDIISSPKHVITSLNTLRLEMNRRYELLRKTVCRSNREYNQKLKEGKLSTTDGYKPMPYIIVVIDEFSDLIIAHGKAIEYPIALLAQKCRPVGIHLITATQNLSSQVLTGILKANFPERIAFKVQSVADSRIIIDMAGAELLMDKGDMLRSDNGWISRIQGAFIDNTEVEKICDWIAYNNSDCKPYVLPAQSSRDTDTKIDKRERDPLFEEIAMMIVSSDIDKIIKWDDYYVSGDIGEIKKIARIPGIINIGVDDIISTLSTTNTNYVTSGKGSGTERILIALNDAVDKLPVKLQDIEKMIVNIWTNRCSPIKILEMKALVEHRGDVMSEINLIWGIAIDPDIKKDEVKVTLLAVNKYKVC